MIKAVFFDLDGTLLNSEKRITGKTKAALIKCKELGINLFVATARPPLLGRMNNLNYSEVEALFNGGVFCNGACLCYKGEKTYSPMPVGIIPEIRDIAGEYPDVNLAVQMTEERHSFLRKLPEDQFGIWGVDENYILPFNYAWEYSVIRILIFQWDGILNEIYHKLGKQIGGQVNMYLTGNSSSIEIVSSLTNKKSGVDNIVKGMKFDPDEVVVFGDDNNDVEMLKGYKHSIAMGNASDDIKRLAGYVTRSNDDDGIYHAMKDYLYLF